MGITTINGVVFSRVPWLNAALPADVTKVDTFVCQGQYELQKPLNKTDAEVEDESTYTNREKLLTGLYSSYLLTVDQAMKNTAGSSGGSSGGSGNKILKRAKADVTEAEFMVPSADQGGTLIATASQLCAALKEEICNLAQTMDISLPLCRGRWKDLEPADVEAMGMRFSCGFSGCDC